MAKRRRRNYAPAHVRLLNAHRDRYDEMLAEQDGHCALCPATPKNRKLALDHDHRKMIIRGLLCNRCNRGLPYWMTPEWLRGAAEYLERYVG